MLVKYEYYTRNGDKIGELSIEDFIKMNLKKEFGEDSRCDLQIKVEATFEVLCQIVSVLIEKNLFSIKDLESILPHKNYNQIICLTYYED